MKTLLFLTACFAFLYLNPCFSVSNKRFKKDDPTIIFQLSDQDELRSKIKSTLFVSDQLPKLNSQSYGVFEPCPGVIAERVSYSTLYNLEIPGILYLPNPRPIGKIPALIIVNGHGGDKYSWYSYYAGMIYAKAGAAVLTYDPIGEGERNIDRKSGTRAHDKYHEPTEIALKMSGSMIVDVMQAVSFLSERDEIDKNKIATLGYSMGSFVLALTGSVDTRINSVVLASGGNLDGPNGYWDGSKPMCQGIPYKSLSFLGSRPEVLYSLHASRGTLLIHNGLQDSVVAVPRLGTWSFFDKLYENTYKLIGNSTKLFEYNFTEGGGHRPYFITKPVAIWLEKQLDFPNWTESDIKSMDVTHIGEWAINNSVEMDKNYFTEIREAGTIAIGSGIPALNRNDLHVFPLEIWTQNKDKLIYESWLNLVKLELKNN